MSALKRVRPSMPGIARRLTGEIRLHLPQRAARPGRRDPRADARSRNPARMDRCLDTPRRARPPAGGRDRPGGTEAVPVPRRLAGPAGSAEIRARPALGGAAAADAEGLRARPRRPRPDAGTGPRRRRAPPRPRVLPDRLGGLHRGERLVRPGDPPPVAHVRVTGEEVRFDFRARAASVVQTIRDRQLARLVGSLLRRRGGGRAPRLPGRKGWRDVRSEDINAYLKDLADEEISAKDFRTWHATVLTAASLASEEEGLTSVTSRKRVVSSVVKEVAASLGNTPAVCRASYVDPRVVDRFLDGGDDRAAARTGSHGRSGPRVDRGVRPRPPGVRRSRAERRVNLKEPRIRPTIRVCGERIVGIQSTCERAARMTCGRGQPDPGAVRYGPGDRPDRSRRGDGAVAHRCAARPRRAGAQDSNLD